MRIDEAPLKEPLTSGNMVARIWNQFFSGLADGLAGNWRRSPWQPVFSGSLSSPTDSVIIYQGRTLFLKLTWATTFLSTEAVLTLPVSVESGVLYLAMQTAGTWSLMPVEVIDKTIILPDTGSQKAYLSGTLIIRSS